jgi:hypothetical protein
VTTGTQARLQKNRITAKSMGKKVNMNGKDFRLNEQSG